MKPVEIVEKVPVLVLCGWCRIVNTFLSLQLADIQISSIDLKVDVNTPVTIELTFIAKFTHCPRVIIPELIKFLNAKLKNN